MTRPNITGMRLASLLERTLWNPWLQRQPVCANLACAKGIIGKALCGPLAAQGEDILNFNLWSSTILPFPGLLTCMKERGAPRLVLASIDKVVHMSNRYPDTQIWKRQSPVNFLLQKRTFLVPRQGHWESVSSSFQQVVRLQKANQAQWEYTRIHL